MTPMQLSSLLVVALCAASRTQVAAALEPITADDLTKLITRDSGWNGGDGCASLKLTDGRIVWLFSDSYVGTVKDGTRSDGNVMINNAVAITPAEPPYTLEFAYDEPQGKPTAPFIPPTAASAKSWYWLTGGAAESAPGGKNTLVLFAWEMGSANKQDAGIWNFENRGTDIFIVENPKDEPSLWRYTTKRGFETDGGAAGQRRSWGSTVATEGAYHYIYGVDSTAPMSRKLLVARSLKNDLANTDRWTFWNGTTWAQGASQAHATEEGIADEFTVHHLRDGGREAWIMVQMEGMLGKRIMVRAAASPQGPWTDPKPIYTAPEPDQDKRLFVYSAKAHPHLPHLPHPLNQRDRLVISYCCNSQDFGHAYRDAWIYRPRFISIPLSDIIPLTPPPTLPKDNP